MQKKFKNKTLCFNMSDLCPRSIEMVIPTFMIIFLSLLLTPFLAHLLFLSFSFKTAQSFHITPIMF